MPHRQAVVADEEGRGRGAVTMRTPHSSAVRILALALLLASMASAFACTHEQKAERRQYLGTAMGCRVEITVDESDADIARHAAHEAQLELDRLDAMLSDWKESSELSRLNASSEMRVRASGNLRAALARALEVARATDGRFDPTVKPLVDLWRASRKSRTLPATDALAAARARCGFAKVAIDGDAVTRETKGDGADGDARAQLDFGGIGKGFGAVRALEVLRANGCPRALVAVAGDIAAGEAPRGERGWRVDVAPESDVVRAQRIIAVNQAVSTSGGSMQWVEIGGVRYAHIVDPRTGLGATKLAQVTVVGPLDCAVDALSTALALSDDDADAAAILAKFPGYTARIERDGKAVWIPAPIAR